MHDQHSESLGSQRSYLQFEFAKLRAILQQVEQKFELTLALEQAHLLVNKCNFESVEFLELSEVNSFQVQGSVQFHGHTFRKPERSLTVREGLVAGFEVLGSREFVGSLFAFVKVVLNERFVQGWNQLCFVEIHFKDVHKRAELHWEPHVRGVHKMNRSPITVRVGPQDMDNSKNVGVVLVRADKSYSIGKLEQLPVRVPVDTHPRSNIGAGLVFIEAFPDVSYFGSQTVFVHFEGDATRFSKLFLLD